MRQPLPRNIHYCCKVDVARAELVPGLTAIELAGGFKGQQGVGGKVQVVRKTAGVSIGTDDGWVKVVLVSCCR